jgi:hypothetical protein
MQWQVLWVTEMLLFLETQQGIRPAYKYADDEIVGSSLGASGDTNRI